MDNNRAGTPGGPHQRQRISGWIQVVGVVLTAVATFIAVAQFMASDTGSAPPVTTGGFPPVTTPAAPPETEPAPSSDATTRPTPTDATAPDVVTCLAPTLRLSPRAVRPGQALRVESCGFAPNERVFGWMGRSFPWTEQPLELGSLVTDGDGLFTIAFEVPSAFPSGPAVILYHPLDSDPLGGVGPFATAELTVR